MRSEEEIRKFIEYASKEREKAQDELNMRTSVFYKGVMDALSWVLEEKDIKSIEDYVESGFYKKKI